MSRIHLLAGTLIVAAAVVAVAFCAHPRPASAGTDWLADFDQTAKEFTAEMIVDGKAYPLQGPRRMIYYTPEKSPISSVFAGACYALHINGNPEAVIAIENSGDPAKPNTYIEISRLSGGAVNVYRKGEKVAEFPAMSGVRGAYVGMGK